MDHNLQLNSQIKFSDLYNRDGLLKLMVVFEEFFAKKNNQLYQQFLDLKLNPGNFPKKDQSNLLIEIAKILEEFLVEIFAIQKENQLLQKRHQELAVIYKIKRQFVQKEIARRYKAEDVVDMNLGGALEILEKIDLSFLLKLESSGFKDWIPAFARMTKPDEFPQISNNFDIEEFELKLALLIDDYQNNWQNNHQKNPEKFSEQLKNLEIYCAFALYNQSGIAFHQNGALFKLPQKIDRQNLLKPIELRERNGFKLSDCGYNLNQVLGQAHYCIFCHNQGKDSCSIGIKSKDNNFQNDQFGEELSGCPLEQKISEMNFLKSEGFNIGALATVIIDNPMAAATGSRICNDCMKSCIYQKQDAVDIPQIETKLIKDVLNLPYGFEIYSLLTRWNPLNLERPIEKPITGHKILIAGLGPAGFTLAHHLLNEGHLVVAIDGLKIEPLAPEISGIDLAGMSHKFKPIKDIKEIYEELDERVVGGFGGVAEYGITARWDKNFLKIIRLLLERRENFRMFGGMRLGSALSCVEAFDQYDFDHIALCLGAGWPNNINIKNISAKGVRSASDFLMALQLTGADKKNLLTNLQIRLPILVIGAGLTATDTACEALNYYVAQIEKFAARYEILCKKFGAEEVRKNWNDEEKIIAAEFLEHNKEISAAKINGQKILPLLQKKGGVKIIYRKKISDSPAYKSSHHELQKTLEEGVEFIEEAVPSEVIIDEFGHIKALKIFSQNQEKIIAAKSLFLAIGTAPNKAPFYEDELAFALDDHNNNFQIIDLFGNKIVAPHSPKSDNISFFAAKNNLGKIVSVFGDIHPSFAGSVVRAMASAKKGYKQINQALAQISKKAINNYQKFLQKINCDFTVQVKELNILADNIFELVVFAPALARRTKLGHIFRLHNYNYFAREKNGTLLMMEGVPVTAYKIDQERGLITVIIIDRGGSSSLIRNFKINEAIIFMGPGGAPAQIVNDQTMLLIADSFGNMPLAAMAAEYKKQNCRVLFFVSVKRNADLIRQNELEQACDSLIIAVEDEAPKIKLNRQSDYVFRGTVIEALISYSKDELCKEKIIDYSQIDFLFTMGSEDMMQKIAQIRHQELKPYLNPSHIGIASLNNPMQCMLKGVCAQCLQVKTNAQTGVTKYFYSCINQDQKLDEIDFSYLKNHCQQNSLQEKLTKSWIEYIEHNIEKGS